MITMQEITIKPYHIPHTELHFALHAYTEHHNRSPLLRETLSTAGSSVLLIVVIVS